MARKYQHTMALLPQIKEMQAQGMTQKQIENVLGLTGDRPIHHLLTRERKKDCLLYTSVKMQNREAARGRYAPPGRCFICYRVRFGRRKGQKQ